MRRNSLFQSTRPHGARRNRSDQFSAVSPSFNPRARTGRDLTRMGRGCGASVVSIHAPARGATYAGLTGQSITEWFQSTRPHGARLCVNQTVFIVRHVSIHAPARGATSLSSSSQAISSMFQSTRPHGARQSNPHGFAESGQGFNPRARTGRD